MINRNIGLLMALAGILACLAPVSARAEVLKRTDGRELEGVRIKWFETRREYQVENADGSMIPVAVDDVESVEVAKPADFDKAVQAYKGKQYDVAIPLLENIVTQYRRLQWDNKAREMLANASFAKGDYKKAVQVLGDLMANTTKRLITDEQHVLYWTALMGAQMTAALKKDLNEALAGESKSLAAQAMIKRGDLFKAEGKREDAVLDYMRVVLVFEEAREAHPEALFKASQLLNEMRDPRGDELMKKLMSLYPDSPYARRLGGQM
jgi:hypothetical protein